MAEEKEVEGKLKRFFRYITFNDVPIKKRFMLFAAGLGFWLVVLFIIVIATLLDLNSTAKTIAREVLPHDKVVQKIDKRLQVLAMDLTMVLFATDSQALNKSIETSERKIVEIRSLLSTLKLGGHVNDISLYRDAHRKHPGKGCRAQLPGGNVC